MKTALLVIDVQRSYTNPQSDLFCKNYKKTIQNINYLIENIEISEIIYVRHEHKKDGTDVGRMYDYNEESADGYEFVAGTESVEYDPNLIVIKTAKTITKTRYSAFSNTDLEEYLRKNTIKKIIVTGFMTNFCCESTARDAHDKDFYVDFIVDATGTPGTENHNETSIRKIVGEFLSEGFARAFTLKQYLKTLK